MKTHTQNKGLLDMRLLIVVVSFFVLIPNISYAAVVYDAGNSSLLGGGNSFALQEFTWSGSVYEDVPNWTISSITVPWERTTGSGSVGVDAFISNNSSTYGGAGTIVSGDIQSTSGSSPQEHTWTFFPPINLRDYAEATGNSSGAIKVGIGKASGTAFFSPYRWTGSPSLDGTLRVDSGTPGGDLTAVFNGSIVTNFSEITAINLPSPPSQTAAATTTTFEFEYTSATPVATHACIVYERVNPTPIEYAPVCENVTQSGSGLTFNEDIEFTNDSYFLWRAVLFNANNERIAQSSLYTWQTGDSSTFTPDPTLIQDLLDQTATSSAPNAFFSSISLGVTQMPPFSYYFQIEDAYDTAANQLAEDQMLPLTQVPFGHASTTIYFTVDFLDADAITALTGEAVWGQVRALIALVLWLMFGMSVWSMLQSRFNIQ